jgi:CoA:oxalate CoA-transferase
MLGMTNAQRYWPSFCAAIDFPNLERNPRFSTLEARAQHAEELVGIIEGVFLTKSYAEWIKILTENRLVWSPVMTPLEVTRDKQAEANEFFVEWDHSTYGKIKTLNNPIKLSKTAAEIKSEAPKLGEHSDEILTELGYSKNAISRMKEVGTVG